MLALRVPCASQSVWIKLNEKTRYAQTLVEFDPNCFAMRGFALRANESLQNLEAVPFPFCSDE